MPTSYDDLPLYEPKRSRRRPWSPTRKRRLRRSLGWLALGMAIVVAAVGVYAGATYLHFTSSVDRVSGVIGSHSGAGQAQNILLVGNDQRPANMTPQQYAELSTTPDGGTLDTDTMIVLHVTADGSAATLVSFPRDSYVSIPGFGKNRLNQAYSDGVNSTSGTSAQKDAAGMRLLIKTIQGLSGIVINHYVKVSLLSFYNIANALPPITVCLKNAVDDPNSGAHFPAGVQKLDARQALQFVRQRDGLPLGDLDREVRQQYFLSVEAQQILSAGTLLNPVKLNRVVGAVGSSLEMDDQLSVLSLATQLKGLRSGNIHSATVPLAAEPFGVVRGLGDIVYLNTGALPDFFDGIEGLPTSAQKVTTAKAAAPASVTVDVLNGSGVSGASRTGLDTYASLGFQVGQPGDAAATQQQTTVYFPVGAESQAKAALQYLPGAAVEQSSSYQHVTVVLGTDGKLPTAHPGGASGSSGSSSAGSSAGKSSGSSAAPGSGSGATSAASAPSPSPSTHSYSSAACID